MNSGLQQQVLHRPKAELAFRPWWDSVEDTMLAAMLAIGNTNITGGSSIAHGNTNHQFTMLAIGNTSIPSQVEVAQNV